MWYACSPSGCVTACVVHTANSIRRFDSKTNRTADSIRFKRKKTIRRSLHYIVPYVYKSYRGPWNEAIIPIIRSVPVRTDRAVVQHYNAAIHITMHNTQRQFCYSTPASRPTLHLRCGHKELGGRRPNITGKACQRWHKISWQQSCTSFSKASLLSSELSSSYLTSQRSTQLTHPYNHRSTPTLGGSGTSINQSFIQSIASIVHTTSYKAWTDALDNKKYVRM